MKLWPYEMPSLPHLLPVVRLIGPEVEPAAHLDLPVPQPVLNEARDVGELQAT